MPSITLIVLQIESKKVDETLYDSHCLLSMQKELNQFVINIDVWKLVQKPKDASIIGTKWVFRNKLDLSLWNKARLFAKEYNQ